MARPKKVKGIGGRKKRSKNRGWWYRTSRGWYTTVDHTSVPLLDTNGNHIKPREAEKEAEAAYHRCKLEPEEEAGEEPTKKATSAADRTVREACLAYLDYAEKHAAPSTYNTRANFLYDFVTGYPAKYRHSHNGKPPAKERIHCGYGDKAVEELIRLDIDNWLDAHPDWKGSQRTAVQAVKRVLNWSTEKGLTARNPIKGYKSARPNARLTYIDPEIEKAIYQHASLALALLFKVCIRTGSRPISEFGSVEARHVEETERGQLWRFPATEHKTGHRTVKDRLIFVPEEIAEIVRQQIAKYPKGKLFRSKSGKPWNESNAKATFDRLRTKLRKNGVKVPEGTVIYSARHTYAKRMLGGFWGKPVSLNTLADLMGNSVEVCRKHYGELTEGYLDPYWKALGQ